MKPFLVFTCVFTFSLALEYNFDFAPLGQPSSIRLNKRLSSPSQQHGRSNVQDEKKDNNVEKESFQTERKRSEKRPDGIASTHSRSSTQGNNHQKCYYDMNVTVIIKTNKSLSAGAKFVKYVQAENSMECARKCCDISNCNQAIFENKDDYSCYLFDCGEPSVCVFAPHKSYISMSFAQKKHHSFEDSSHHQESKHENELAGLDKQNPLFAASGGFPSSSSSASSLPKTTSTTTSTTLTPPISLSTTLRTTTQRKPKIVSLNDDCTSVDKCEDNHAECVQEKCTCQSGYYIKYGICRRQCDKHHFECDKKTDFKNGLDCIELQHVCDGIPQCADSSDEEGCSPDANLQNKPLSHNLGKDIHVSETQLSNGGIPKIRPTKTHGHYQATGNGPKGSFHQSATGSNPNIYGDQSPSMKVGIQQQPSSGMHTESKMHIVDEEKDTDSTKTEDTPKKTKEDSKENPALSDAQNGTSVPINNQKSDTPAPTPTTTTKATPPLVNGPISGMQNITSSQTDTGLAKFLQQSNYILKEKVVVASPTDNAQGPIVALALGLSFTTMLLIFVGCRLRRVKRRLRKGRALHSNEADYLVNGMYL